MQLTSMKPQFIGGKKIKISKELEEKTQGGTPVIKVLYEDGTEEHFSKLAFDLVVDTKPCDLTQLQRKRVEPVVKVLAGVIMEYGIQVGDLDYVSALLNKSLQYNSDQALLMLIGKWMPKPLSLDNVDYITVDRILRNANKGNQ